MTLEQLYAQAIGPLPTSDRLRLATMILNQIPPQSIVDDRDDWSDEDMRDLAVFASKASFDAYPEDDDLVDAW